MQEEIIFNIDVMLAKRKMSVTELADKVGITIANISILKNGKAITNTIRHSNDSYTRRCNLCLNIKRYSKCRIRSSTIVI